MNYETITLKRDGRVAYLSVARPERLNALNRTVLAELDQAFAELERDNDMRVVVVTGSGEKSFVAGADIHELQDLASISDAVNQAEYGQAVFNRVEQFPKPVLMAINGYALGGGCELALAGDIRLAAEEAKLGFPEINLGIHPGWGGTQRLPHLVGLSRAKRLIFSGELIGAAEAYRIGLVDEVVTSSQLPAAVQDLANRLADKAPVALRMAKLSLNASVGSDVASGCRIEAACFVAVCSTQDRIEGTRAFLEKRPFNPVGF
jgi:enoyl-CoA hydratase